MHFRSDGECPKLRRILDGQLSEERAEACHVATEAQKQVTEVGIRGLVLRHDGAVAQVFVGYLGRATTGETCSMMR
jgi:hypothetical protein